MFTRRFLVTLTASIALASTLATTAAAAEPWRIAYLSPSFDTSDAWERNYWAIQGRLDELGIEYEMQALAVASHVDHAGQLAQVESVLTRGVDYVVLGPTEYEAAIPALRKLKQANVPTVLYNYIEPHEDETARAMTYVAFDHYEGGRMTGEWAAKWLGGKGKVAIILGAPGQTSDLRKNGFLEVVDQYSDIEIVIGPYTDFDRSKAYDAAQNLLTAHPDLDMIYGLSSSIGLGAGHAVRQIDKSDEIATMGFGGTGDEIVAMNEGWLTASVLRCIDDGGAGVADAMVAHSKGEEVPQVWSGPFVMVDKNSDAESMVGDCNRYSRPKMGR
ncbi:MAG: sugar ABC transporter substrate-binding protein [Granulosicoccus sp.]|nr:sugar ABC transporter substrate-binding protein [Granulosicoccus sp.]